MRLLGRRRHAAPPRLLPVVDLRHHVWVEMRDAREAEIVEEPDLVLEAMVDGTMRCTRVSRRLASQEIARRAART